VSVVPVQAKTYCVQILAISIKLESFGALLLNRHLWRFFEHLKDALGRPNYLFLKLLEVPVKARFSFWI
jgi:hypothetical protein